MGLNILFTCAGRRNYLINYFKEALDGKGKVIAADSNFLATALKDADFGILVPKIFDQNYIAEIEKIIAKFEIHILISLNDLELPILTANKERLESKSCRLLLSNDGVVQICNDKWRTHQFIRSIGLNSPETFVDYAEAVKAIEKGELNFPLVLKPRWGSASKDIDYPQNMIEFELSYRLSRLRLERNIPKYVEGQLLEAPIIIQNKLNGIEYGMDILNDFDGNYFGTYAREKLAMRSGETDKARSVVDSNLIKTGKILGEKLGHIGNMDCDIFKEDGKVTVLDLNPRFGGGYPFSHEAGINIPAIYISWLSGQINVDEYDNYVGEKIFAKCDRLMSLK